MMCIKRKRLIELLEKFPLIKDFYEERSKQRRIEFRRIKRIYLDEQNLGSDSEDEVKGLKTKNSAENIITKGMHEKAPGHADETPKVQVPEFLLDSDYYFTKNCISSENILEAEDDNEAINKKLNREEQDQEDKYKQNKTSVMILKIESQIDDTNRALERIKKMLQGNSQVTEDYLMKVIHDAPDIVKPNLEQLQRVVAKISILNSHIK